MLQVYEEAPFGCGLSRYNTHRTTYTQAQEESQELPFRCVGQPGREA